MPVKSTFTVAIICLLVDRLHLMDFSSLLVRPIATVDAVRVNGQQAFPSVSTGSINVQQGSRMSLQCRGSGEPVPDVSWLRNGDPVTASGRYSISEGGAGNNITSVLQVTNVEDGDTGVYTCFAKSEAGTSGQETFITVTG